MSCERIEEAKLTLEAASEALYCLLNMLSQMNDDATVDAAGLRDLLLPVAGNVNAALDNVM